MLTIIRHSEDSNDATFRHDARLTPNGREIAKIKGQTLILKYGIPNLVYCSPFRRTRETLLLMIGDKLSSSKVSYTNGLSRYFSSKERRHPEVAEETRKSKVPTSEMYSQFQRRVRKFIIKVYNNLKPGDNIWLITHSTVYKVISRLFKIRIDDYINPTDHFSISLSDGYKWCQECKLFHVKR